MPDDTRAAGGHRPRHPIQQTSPHRADFRVGLWEEVDRQWPPLGFGALEPSQAAHTLAVLTAATQGMLTPPPPVTDSADEHLIYELEVLRESILCSALFYTIQLLVRTEALGYALSANMRRGQWVQFTQYALHVALRDSEALHGPRADAARAMLREGVLRRLAHELPDAWAVPEHVPTVRARLESDFSDAHDSYSRFPARWVDETTPAASWLLVRSCAHHLADGDAAGIQQLAGLVRDYAQMVSEAMESEACWWRIADLLSSG